MEPGVLESLRVMENYGIFDIQEMPLSSPYFRRKVDLFLEANGLRADSIDLYYSILADDGEILAGAGLCRDIIKGAAVSETARSEGLLAPLVSRLIATAQERGYESLKVFTKPENRAVFESLGFHILAQAPQAILMENGRGLEAYCRSLSDHFHEGRCGVIVMNADPMTLGHRYLIEQAAEQVDLLFVLVLGGDGSRFPSDVRFNLVRRVCGRMGNVTVLSGGDYCISPATFPSYFLKNLDDAAEQQMQLDLDLFVRHIAPALDIRVRFVGSEPADLMTARYNALMREILVPKGIDVCEISRLQLEGSPVSAAVVRHFLDAGNLAGARRLCPDRTFPYLIGDLADWALRKELETPGKPGLVSPGSRGAHADMDEALMRRGIDALRPHFIRFGAMAFEHDFLMGLEMSHAGQAAEQAMLRATDGVNTHKGAIFALGLTAMAAGSVFKREGEIAATSLQAEIAALAEKLRPLDPVISRQTHGVEIVRRYGVRGAQSMALDGYRDVFEDWLPFWYMVKGDEFGLQKLLLKIMSSLDDTCVIHRVGFERARAVKEEAAALLDHFSWEGLQEMDRQCCAERISPGGAADMLALTLYIELLITSD